MDGQRFTASPNLTATLAERERSRRWLALKIGISPTLMHYVITGERTISPEKAALAAAFLGKPIDVLFMSTEMDNTASELEASAA